MSTSSWEVWIDDFHAPDDDPYVVRAHFADQAAKVAVEDHESSEGEFWLLGSTANRRTCMVKKVGEEQIFKFEVTGETIPTYYVRQLKE